MESPLLFGWLMWLGWLGSLIGSTKPDKTPALWPVYTLKCETTYSLSPPKGERFDASALLLRPTGELWTLSDRSPTIYQVELLPRGGQANLIPLTNLFHPKQLTAFAAEKFQHYDSEGLAQDEDGRIYLCEEANRWILRCNPKDGTVERLPIDWTPVEKFFSSDRNASFEGIAIGGHFLYVANERSVGQIIVVDLRTMKVVDHFSAKPSTSQAYDIHYSDLCWWQGELFALLRESYVILKINPQTHKVLAEYNYRAVETDPAVAYQRVYPTSTMEGLAVSPTHFWLVTDNNGQGRIRDPQDIRPTLFKLPRPDPAAAPATQK